jgi:LysM repeat protein
VVREGDTLWSIARRLAPEGDPRPIVDELATANRIDAGSIVPGQALVVSAGS